MIATQVHSLLTARHQARWERYQQILTSPAPTPADAEWLADLCTDGHLSLADVGADESFLRDDQRLVKLYREAMDRFAQAEAAEMKAAEAVEAAQNNSALTGAARPPAISRAAGRRANLLGVSMLLQTDATNARLQLQRHRQVGNPRLRVNAIID